MMENVRKFGTLPVLDSSPYKHFSVYIKQAFKRTSLRERTRMIEMIYVMERRYEKALSCEKKEDAEKSGRSDEKLKCFESSKPFAIRDEITIAMNKMA